MPEKQYHEKHRGRLVGVSPQTPFEPLSVTWSFVSRCWRTKFTTQNIIFRGRKDTNSTIQEINMHMNFWNAVLFIKGFLWDRADTRAGFRHSWEAIRICAPIPCVLGMVLSVLDFKDFVLIVWFCMCTLVCMWTKSVQMLKETRREHWLP